MTKSETSEQVKVRNGRDVAKIAEWEPMDRLLYANAAGTLTEDERLNALAAAEAEATKQPNAKQVAFLAGLPYEGLGEHGREIYASLADDAPKPEEIAAPVAKGPINYQSAALDKRRLWDETRDPGHRIEVDAAFNRLRTGQSKDPDYDRRMVERFVVA